MTQASAMASDHDDPVVNGPVAVGAHGTSAAGHDQHGDDDPHDDEHDAVGNPRLGAGLSLLVGLVIGVVIVAILGFGTDVASLATAQVPPSLSRRHFRPSVSWARLAHLAMDNDDIPGRSTSRGADNDAAVITSIAAGRIHIGGPVLATARA